MPVSRPAYQYRSLACNCSSCANTSACLQVVGSTESRGDQKWKLANSNSDAEKANQSQGQQHAPSSDTTANTSQHNAGPTSSAVNDVAAASALPAASHTPNLDTKTDVESPVVEGMAACTARLDSFADLCGSSNRDKLQAFVQAIFDYQKVSVVTGSFFSVGVVQYVQKDPLSNSSCNDLAISLSHPA